MKKTAKRTVAGTAMAGAVGLGMLGFGTGFGHADPKPVPPIPPLPGIPGPVVPGVPGIPNVGAWVPGMPPGQNPWGPPGQVMKLETLNINGVEVPNPFRGVPPGHWGDLNYINPENIEWLPPGYDLTDPLRLVWNPDTMQWGVFLDDQTFVPFPVQLPAPPPAL